MNDANQPRGDTPAERLTSAEAEIVVAHVVEARSAGLPLAVALRLAGLEAQGKRVRRALLAVAARLEQGEPLDDALAGSLPSLPSHLVALVRASTTCPRGGALLTDFVTYQRQERVLRREIRVALTYPLAVMIAAIFVSVLVPTLFIPGIMEIYQDFQVKIPQSLTAIAWIGDWGMIFLGATTLAVALAAAIARLGLGTARCRSAMMTIPLIGPVWRWMEFASWARALQLLLEGESPLVEALRRTSEGARDWRLSEGVRRVAERVEGGMPLADAMATEELWPETVLAFVRHGEQHRLLPQSLESVALICDERARQRGRWFRLAFPSIVFVLVAHCLIFSYANIVRPLFFLLSMLM